MKFIFLSTDGVLSNQHYIDLISNRGYNYLTQHHNQIDKSKVLMLNYLVNKTKAHVVLTGQWRLLFSLDKLNDMLARNGATFQAVGATPYLYQLSNGKPGTSVDEMEKFIKEMNSKDLPVDDFIILDDQNCWEKYRYNFVKVNYDRGLRHSDLEKCFDHFGIAYGGSKKKSN